MNRIIAGLFACWLLSVGSLDAANGVRCEVSVFQADLTRDSANVVLSIDTFSVVEGIRAVGFVTAFSLELEFTRIDTSEVQFNVHLSAPGPNGKYYSRQFQSELGLPARLEEISGKNSTLYALAVRPFERIDIDTAGCGFVHYRKGDFKFDPSANVDIHFVPHSAGDFYWNGVKGLMEDRYRQFEEINKFNLPGKYQLYLAPCRIYSVLWDNRFDMVIDPARSACYTVFTPVASAADPYVLMYASAARNYGYAPQFLMEGFAGYLSLANFDMQAIASRKAVVPLASLMSTRTYLSTDPYIADRMAASFVRYLIDTYGADMFLQTYRAADDLNLLTTIEQIYQKPVAELEQGWRHYLDTVTVRAELLSAYADQAEVMFDYDRMVELRKAQLALSTTTLDTLISCSELARGYFFLGNYAAASEWEQRVVSIDSSTWTHRMALAGYQMMDGRYDAAEENLIQAQKLDTSGGLLSTFNLGICYLAAGDSARAKELLVQVVNSNKSSAPYVEARIMLIPLLKVSGKSSDREQATTYANEVVAALAQSGPGTVTNPAYYLWNGIVRLMLDDTGDAHDQVYTSLMLDSRAFYQGMACLWLGKIADARGERDVAREYYQQVLRLPAAKYHQAEASTLMQHPYRQ